MISLHKIMAWSLVAILATGSTIADTYPRKTVQLVVPYGAGGPTDLMARTMATCLTKRFKQQVIVLNKPGANGELGANLVKAAAPDGHTIMLGASAVVTGLVTAAAPTFDVRRDLEPISKLAVATQGIYVNASLPIYSIAELVNYAKLQPEKLNYATVGIGSVNHLSTEAFSQVAGIRMVHIPYPQGTGPFLSALMSGEVQVALTDLGGAQAALDSGKVRLIGFLSRERMTTRPMVPAVVEALPAMAPYTGTLWYGFFAPPKTPTDIIRVLNGEVATCAKDSGVMTTFAKIGYEANQIIINSPEEFRTSIQDDVVRLKDVVQKANIQLR
jgi:tripartite-type tricarboxylate transporter receptor subunit TctC